MLAASCCIGACGAGPRSARASSRTGQIELVAARQTCIGLGAFAVHPHLAGTQDAVDQRARGALELAQQEIVHALAVAVNFLLGQLQGTPRSLIILRTSGYGGGYRRCCPATATRFRRCGADARAGNRATGPDATCGVYSSRDTGPGPQTAISPAAGPCCMQPGQNLVHRPGSRYQWPVMAKPPP